VATLQVKTHARSTVSVELVTPQNQPVGKWALEVMPGDSTIPLNISAYSKGVYLLKTKIDGITRLNKLIIL
jgi:uncharacterized protein YfaS (alpha-2-macroglobulin family)